MTGKVLVIAGLAESLIVFRGPLLQAFQSQGLEVHAAAPGLSIQSDTKQQLESAGIRVHDIPLRRTGISPPADLRLLWSLLVLMKSIQPQWVLSYTIKPVIYGTLAAWLAGVPQRFALITGLGYAFTGTASGMRGAIKKLAQGLYRLSLAKAHKVFFQNPDDQSLFRELELLPPKTPSVVVNGSGVDLEQFAPTPLPAAPPRFLMIARLLGDKGVREYAQAAERIREKYPEIRFSIVGWIDDNPDAIDHQELDTWVSKGTLKYLGFMKDVRAAIAECSVFVLPSYREGTPRTVLESMAMGRPIITTDAPGCRETVQEGENGFLVRIKSVDDLVLAMERFVLHSELAVALGQRSRQIAEEKYDVRKVNAVILREMGVVA